MWRILPLNFSIPGTLGTFLHTCERAMLKKKMMVVVAAAAAAAVAVALSVLHVSEQNGNS